MLTVLNIAFYAMLGVTFAAFGAGVYVIITLFIHAWILPRRKAPEETGHQPILEEKCAVMTRGFLTPSLSWISLYDRFLVLTEWDAVSKWRYNAIPYSTIMELRFQPPSAFGWFWRKPGTLHFRYAQNGETTGQILLLPNIETVCDTIRDHIPKPTDLHPTAPIATT